ncbi:ASCH domain-containing protein [Chryseobacterium arthrosphaerae]|uniref:ASCH domain-containing protein n=1 Tax=Chryseobacterium arthrosphaerae TaxID=651561 RepID=A0ABU7R2W1_9FLAO
MKALSIKQPFASLIAHGIKPIENRTWKTNFRGRIYIHACTPRKFEVKFSNEQTIEAAPILKQLFDNTLPFGAIIGEVDIVDCVINHPSIWAEKTPFCPITGLQYFADIINESGQLVETYGGPFDSYTIPVPDEDDPNEFIRARFCHDRGQWTGDEMISKVTKIPRDRKPIYNWVLDNAELYSEPILNVKGKLSLWELS